MLENLKKFHKAIFCAVVIICTSLIFFMDFAVVFRTLDGYTLYEKTFNLYELAFNEGEESINNCLKEITVGTDLKLSFSSATAQLYLVYWLIVISLAILSGIVYLIKNRFIKKEIEFPKRLSDFFNNVYTFPILIIMIIGVLFIINTFSNNFTGVNLLNQEVSLGMKPGFGVYASLIFAFIAALYTRYIKKLEDKQLEEKVLNRLREKDQNQTI